ncbi:MAG: 3-dehydroquinate dehydratase [Marinilabiliales bacterium]|nr:MAG: 3-dehydroquinate dehydratase [Marinilabiliales bacterium]
MKSRILIINGPNLNLTGIREQGVYGKISFIDFLENLQEFFPKIKIDHYQSNIEGELIDKMQESMYEYNAVVLNAGGYTHTSIALGDAIKAIDIPVVEVHISNIFSRETYRHTSYLAPYCIGSISGFGLDSYRLAIEHLIKT